MNFIKANLYLPICGAVVLLVLVYCLWPKLNWDNQVRTKMSERIAQGPMAERLVMHNVEIIPGAPKLPVATAELNLIQAKERALADVKRQAEEVRSRAAAQNSAGRIAEERGGRKNGVEVPLLSGTPEPYFLPKTVAPQYPLAFGLPYQNQFPAWLGKLVGGTRPAVPPTVEDVTALIAQANADLKAAAASALFQGPGGAAAVNTLTPQQENDKKRDAVYQRASSIRCYVDKDALQMRDWGRGSAPDEKQMFEAVVDSWLQQDVVNAISTLNGEELKKYGKDEQNVGHSPVKRLERIVIGNNAIGAQASGGPGELFFGPPGSAPAPGGSGPASQTLTRHVSNDTYDVVLMRITLYMDPAFENQLINALYRENNGYTVLNINTRVVDPLDAAGNGFLYGQTQVVRLDIVVENLLFRSWTVPLMPDEIKKQLSIGTGPAAGGAGGGATGAAGFPGR